jgi:hypothetical protein
MIMFSIALKCRIQDIDPDCQYLILTTPEEKALNAAYRDLKSRGEVASQKALLGVAELSPAYHLTLERSKETIASDIDSLTDKQ